MRMDTFTRHVLPLGKLHTFLHKGKMMHLLYRVRMQSFIFIFIVPAGYFGVIRTWPGQLLLATDQSLRDSESEVTLWRHQTWLLWLFLEIRRTCARFIVVWCVVWGGHNAWLTPQWSAIWLSDDKMDFWHVRDFGQLSCSLNCWAVCFCHMAAVKRFVINCSEPGNGIRVV